MATCAAESFFFVKRRFFSRQKSTNGCAAAKGKANPLRVAFIKFVPAK
jgi:hypothetical protein